MGIAGGNSKRENISVKMAGILPFLTACPWLVSLYPSINLANALLRCWQMLLNTSDHGINKHSFPVCYG